MEPSTVGLSQSNSTGALLTNSTLPYAELLTQRPWEGPVARTRLNVPTLLLPGHCPVITNWVVITGATSAGKTTIIKELENRGLTVCHEKARNWLEIQVEKGLTVEQARSDDYYFRHQAFNHTRRAEVSYMHRAHELIFFDRSSIDCLSFHRASGYNPNELVPKLPTYRFSHVFHLDPLPFVKDGFRTANEERRMFLDAALERDYLALSYLPVRIPRMSVEDRLQVILQRLTRGIATIP